MTTEKILATIETLDAFGLIEAHNIACREGNDFDSVIYDMSEINEFFYGETPECILHRMFFGNFNPMHTWFSLNGYGNLVSFDSREDLNGRVFPSDIAYAYNENPAAFKGSALAQALDAE